MDERRPPWMNEELQLLRESVARFAEAEMVPQEARWRAQHSVGKEIWRRAGEQGFLCTDVPADFGGGGGDFRHEAVVYEELNRRGLIGLRPGRAQHSRPLPAQSRHA